MENLKGKRVGKKRAMEKRRNIEERNKKKEIKRVKEGSAGATSGKVNTGSEQEHNQFVLDAYYKRSGRIAQILLT